jgi:ResB-like family
MNSGKLVHWVKGIIPHLASLRISVVCLLLLFILTAWGTVYQAEAGLYAAQVRFFYSIYFLVWGFLPLPGAQLVLWVLFFNLAASMLFRVSYRFSNIGNIITHFGFLFLLAGSFITYRYAQESYLPLNEKEVSNVSIDRRQWELAVWTDEGFGLEKRVSTFDVSPKKIGQELDFSEFGFKALVQNYYRNCMAIADTTSQEALMGRGKIGSLKTRRPEADPEDNLAGMILHIKSTGEDLQEMILYGGQMTPNSALVKGKSIQLELRKARHPLPITLRLVDVKKEDYPGTGIPRSYHSDVEFQSEGMELKTRISMNNPLHYKNFTFYQASYNVDSQGRESSVLAVVENTGRLLPYISGTMIFGGMVIHFLMMLFGFNMRKPVSVNEVEK